MQTTRTFEGLEIRLTSRGMGRYFSAAFLAFWLCGWAAGEFFALAFLIGTAWLTITGQPLHPSMPKIDGGATLPVAGFLLVWLTLWTFGGWAAGQAFLRLLWGEDRLVARPDGLRVIRRAGPFRRTREIPRNEIRQLYRTPGRGLQRTLMADTEHGAVKLTEFASGAELDQLEAELTRELGLRPSTTAALPAGWEETTLPEGGPALIESPAKRRRQALLVSTITAALTVAACAIASGGHFAVGAVLGGLAFLFGWGALRLLFGRHEWRWTRERLHLDWRFGGKVRPVFEGVSLELDLASDSDNDSWYELKLFATPPPEPGLALKARHHKSIARTLRDPLVPRALGEWLSRRSGLPLLDRTTASAKSEQFEQMRQHLAASGKLGSWVAKLLPPSGGR
ncbi:MAG: hypothetical protein IPL39_02435 [Opitutaceae bacterium]|nr:hypothetical protein [Opitutaceae bacterium]